MHCVREFIKSQMNANVEEYLENNCHRFNVRLGCETDMQCLYVEVFAASNWQVRRFKVNETKTNGETWSKSPLSTSNLILHYNFSFITINCALFPLIYLRSFEHKIHSLRQSSFHSMVAKQSKAKWTLRMSRERMISFYIIRSHSSGKVLHHSQNSR